MPRLVPQEIRVTSGDADALNGDPGDALTIRPSEDRSSRVAKARDPFLDGLRAISVCRVVLLHLLQHVQHPFVVTFSFLMPGMPLMFFVSGALAGAGLTGADTAKRNRFWRERGRRLLVPFWAFGAVILLICAAGAILRPDEPAHDFPVRTLGFWVLPLAGPQASVAFDQFDWHLWFLSSLLLLLASAPWTLALHRRLPFVGALAFLAAGAWIEIARIDVPGVLRNTLLFGAAFQFGYGYTDGRLLRAPRALLAAIAVGLAAFALLFHAARSPDAMVHDQPLALLTLGLGFVALWMCVRERVVPFFERERPRRWISAINARAYTIFLWGPIANFAAGRIVRPETNAQYLVEFALSLVFLAICVRVFGPVEAWAARRKPKSATSTPGAESTVPTRTGG